MDEPSRYRVVEKVELDDEGREWLTGASPPLLSLEGARRLLRHRVESGKPGRLQVNDGSGWRDLS
jgi:hypothetical protein